MAITDAQRKIAEQRALEYAKAKSLRDEQAALAKTAAAQTDSSVSTGETPFTPTIDKNFTVGAPVYLDVNGMFTTKKSEGARQLYLIEDPLTQQLTLTPYASTPHGRRDDIRPLVMNINTYQMLNKFLDANWTPSQEDYQKFPEWMSYLRQDSLSKWREANQPSSEVDMLSAKDAPLLDIKPVTSQEALASQKYQQGKEKKVAVKTQEGIYLMTPEERAQLNRGEVRLPGQYTAYITMEDGSIQPGLLSISAIKQADKTFMTLNRPVEQFMQPLEQSAKSNPFAALAKSFVNWAATGVAKALAEFWNVGKVPLLATTNAARVVLSKEFDWEDWVNWWGMVVEDQKEIFRQLDNATRDLGASWADLIGWMNDPNQAKFTPRTKFEALTQTNIPFIMGGVENAVPMGMMGFNEQQNEINRDVAQTRQIAAMEEARLNEASNSLFAESLAIIRSGTNDPQKLEKATEATRKAIEIDMRLGYVTDKYGFSTVNPYYAFSTSAKPEELELFIKNLVQVSLQKQAKGLGTHLSEFEVFKIKEMVFDPGIEMVGQMLSDWTNIIDFGPVIAAMKGVKGTSKLASAFSDGLNVLQKAAVEYDWQKAATKALKQTSKTGKIFTAEQIANMNGVFGGVIRTAVSFNGMKTAIKSKASKEAAIANDVFTSIAKSVVSTEDFINAMDDVAEVAKATVRGTADENLLKMPVSFGVKQMVGMSEISKVINPDKWKTILQKVVDDVRNQIADHARQQILRTMKKAGRDTTSEAGKKALEDAVAKVVDKKLKPKVVVPQFADAFRVQYLNNGKIWRNSDILYDSLVGKLVNLSGGVLAEPTSKFGNVVRWVSQLSNVIMNGWYKGVLSLRPAWVIRNYQDNVGRFVIAGGKFGGDLAPIIASFPGGVPPANLFQSMQSVGISDPTSPIYRVLNEGTKFKSFLDFYTYRIKEVYRGFPKSILPKKDLTVPQNIARSGWKILEAGVVNPFRVVAQGTGDWNSYVEFSFRVRLYHTKYTEGLAKLRPLFEAENLAKLPEDFRVYGKALLDASNNDPIRMSQLLKLQDESESVIFSYLIPDEVEKLFADASPTDRQLFILPVQQKLAEWVQAFRANGKVPKDADLKVFFTELIEQAKEANDNIARMGNEARQNPIDLSKRPTPEEDAGVLDEVLEGTTEKPAKVLPNSEARKMWNDFRNKGIKPDEAELKRVLAENGIEDSKNQMKDLEQLVKKNDKPTVEPKKVPEKKVTVTSTEVNSDIDAEDLFAHNEALKARGRLLTPRDEQWTEEYKAARDAQIMSRVDMTEKIEKEASALAPELQIELGKIQLRLSDWMDKSRKMIYAMFPWGGEWSPDIHQWLWRRFEVYRTAARQAQANLEKQIIEAVDEMLKSGTRSTKLDIDPLKLFKDGGIDVKVDANGYITELVPMIEVDGKTPASIKGMALKRVINDLMPRYNPELNDIENLKGLIGDNVTRTQMLHHIPPMVTVKQFDGTLAFKPNIAETFQTKRPPATVADFQDPVTFVDPNQTPLKTKQWVVVTAEYPMDTSYTDSAQKLIDALETLKNPDGTPMYPFTGNRRSRKDLLEYLRDYNAKQTAKLKQELDEVYGAGNYIPVDGNYGKQVPAGSRLPKGLRTDSNGNIIENSFLIPGGSADQALDLGKRYNQDAVLTQHGFVYQDGKIAKTKSIDFDSGPNATPISQFFSEIEFPDGQRVKFASDINWGGNDSELTMLGQERGRSVFVDLIRRVALQYQDNAGRSQLKSTNDVALANILKKHLKEVYPKMELPKGGSLPKIVDAMLDYVEGDLRVIQTPEQLVGEITKAFNKSAQNNYQRSLPEMVKTLKDNLKKVKVEQWGLDPEYVDDEMKLFDYWASNWAREKPGRSPEEWWYTKFGGAVSADARLSLEGKWLYLMDPDGIVKPVWYSPLEKVVENGLTDRSYPNGMAVIKRLRSLPGVKKEELEITGVFDWLADLTPEEIAKGIQLADGSVATSLTPEVVLDYIKQHELSWEEVWQGSDTAVMAGMGRQAKYKIVDRYPAWQEYSLPTNMNDESLKFNWFATFPNAERYSSGHYSGIKNLEQWVRGDVVEIDKNITALLINEIQSDVDEAARDAAKHIRWDLYEHYGDKDVLSANLGFEVGGKGYQRTLKNVLHQTSADAIKRIDGGDLPEELRGLLPKIEEAINVNYLDEDVIFDPDKAFTELGKIEFIENKIYNPWQYENQNLPRDVQDSVYTGLFTYIDTLVDNFKADMTRQVDEINNMVIPDISENFSAMLGTDEKGKPIMGNKFMQWLQSVATEDEVALMKTGGYMKDWDNYLNTKAQRVVGEWMKDADNAKFIDDLPIKDVDIKTRLKNALDPNHTGFNSDDREDSILKAMEALKWGINEGASEAEFLPKIERLNKLRISLRAKVGGLIRGAVEMIPRYPFSKNYTEVAFKRMLRKAVDDGHEYLTWTTGEQQIKRWNNLRLGWEEQPDGSWKVFYAEAVHDDGTDLVPKLASQTYIVKEFSDVRKLPGEIGNSWAETLWKEIKKTEAAGKTSGSYRPLEEGMVNFYDKEPIRLVEEWNKKYGLDLKVEDISYQVGNEAITVHGIKLTDKAKTWAEGGLPLFLQDPKTSLKRAGTIFDRSGRGNMVGFLKAQTPFDALHEMMHIGITDLPTGDWPVISKWLGELPEAQRVKLTGDEFADLHRKYLDNTISNEEFKIYSKASENINNGIVKTLIEGENNFVSPEVKSVLQRIINAIKKWYEAVIKGTLYEVELTPEVRKVFTKLFDQLPDAPVPEVVRLTDDMKEVWKTFQVAPGVDGKNWLESANHPRVKWEDPNAFLQSLKDIAATETDPNIADYYRTLTAKAEGQLKKLEETSWSAADSKVPPKRKKVLTPIPDAKLPLEYQSWLALQKESVTSMNRAIAALIAWQDSLSDSFAKAAKGEASEFFFSKQKPAFWKTMQDWADTTARDLQEMINTASYGGNYRGQVLQGAVPQTNEAMLDYTNWNQWENVMRTIYPFWMFPSRSTVFWAKTLATHPAIAMWYQKYMMMSERQVYQEGLVTSRGEPLPSFRGYVKIAGTDIWFNPTAALSFRYVLNPLMGFTAGDNASVSDFGGEEVSPLVSVIRELYRVGLDYGFQPSPVFSFIPMVQEGLGVENTSAQTIIPMLELMPLNWRRQVVDGLRIKSPSIRNAIAAEPPWKNYLIENKMLKDALEKIMVETDDADRYATAMGVRTVFTTADSLGNPTRETNKAWLDARTELEKTQLWQKYVSYFTSFYGKPYTDADAALQDLREENNLLRSMINNEIGAYIFDLDPDASQRYDDYIHNAYETPEGAIYRMRQAISWVTTAEGDQITDPEDRLRRLNQIWSDDTKREAKYEALHESRMLYEEEMSQVPVGAPYELKEQILQRYWDRNDAINSNKDYVTIEDSPEWNPVNKPEEKILDHYRYNWFKDLRTLLAPYDPTAESWADYNLRKETWEKELPKYAAQLAKTYKESIQRDSIKLFPMLGWGAQVQPPVEEAPGVTLADRIIQQLMAESNPEGMDNYYKKNDTINEALGWAWDELYANKYWEMIDGLTGDERTIAINRFYTLYPASSITPQMLAEKVLSHPTYAKSGWTQAQLVSAYLKAGYMDIDESQEASQSDGEKKVSEVFDYLGWADPGKEKSALQDKIEELGGSEVAKDLQLLYTSGGSTLLAQPKNAERLDALLKAVKYAVVSLGIEQPKDAELTIRVEAKDQNELYQSKAKETLGADIFEISSVYYGLSYSGQKQFRDTYPDDYKRILALSKFKDTFGEMYPLWKSFYDPNGKSSSSGESGTWTSTKKKTTSTSSKTQKWEYPLRDDFPQMGKRYSLDFRKLISGYYVGKAGVAGKPVWPQEMMDALSEMFFKEATEAMEAGEELSASAETYLNSLSTTHPDWKGPIDEIKRIIKENASQGVAGGKWVAETQ